MAFLTMIAGAAINALCFTGTSYAFSKLSDHGETERRKHDEARIKYDEDRQEHLDFINEELQRERHAEKTFSEIDEAMEQYYLTTKKRLPALPPKPVLSDFYHPSEQQKSGEIAFIVAGLTLVGYLIYIKMK